jgi:hypothetical protein
MAIGPAVYAASRHRVETKRPNRSPTIAGKINIPLLSGRHGVSHRSIQVVIPGNGTNGEGGRGDGGNVHAGGGLGSTGASRGGTLGK